MFFFKRLLFFPVHVLDSAGGAGKGGGGGGWGGVVEACLLYDLLAAG